MYITLEASIGKIENPWIFVKKPTACEAAYDHLMPQGC